MNLLIGIAMFVAFWGVIGGLTWWFGDRQGDVHPHHTYPYRTKRDDD